MLPYGRKNPLPFLYSLSSPITTVPSKGKGEIYKRVENRRLSTLLYARAASAHSPPRGAANPRRPQTANPPLRFSGKLSARKGRTRLRQFVRPT